MDSLGLACLPLIVLVVIAFFGKFLAEIVVTLKGIAGDEVVATGEVVCEDDLDAVVATLAIKDIISQEVVHYPGETFDAKFTKTFGEDG